MNAKRRQSAYPLWQFPLEFLHLRLRILHDQWALCNPVSKSAPQSDHSITTTQFNTYRQAQYSNAPFPLPIRVSLPLTQTGISGNTRIQHSAPLTALIFRLTATSADVSCLAVRRVDSSSRRPYVPSCSVVPFIEPPWII